jgi:excisionase family DNA binding protein
MNLLTTAEVCEKLRVSRNTLNRWISSRLIPVIRVGRRKNLFDETAVEAALKKRTAR